MIFERSRRNPILTRADVPDVPPDIVDVTSVFNPGAVMHEGRHLLMVRVQTRGRETRLMTAESDDGESFRILPREVRILGLDRLGGGVFHVYDPRITVVDDERLVMFAMDTEQGCRLGVARTSDFATLEFLGAAPRDLRNGVLFPEKVQGKYLRLDRPNTTRRAGEPATGSEIWLSESDDLVSWKPLARVMSGRPRYWDELIGPGPPPVKTPAGWLHIYHGVATHFASANVYQAGAVLLDLDDPSRVVSRTRANILEPREIYELVGQVPNVVFPTGLTVDEYDGYGFAPMESKVRLYYGAADTCVCAAASTIERIVRACGG
jgi:predicted GH43/DUF377 family glycosyl hydrolase